MHIMTEREVASAFDNYLDEVYGDVKIAGLKYATSQVLNEVDLCAYEQGLLDWADSEDIEIKD